MSDKINYVLHHKNWTGLTLLELIESGRIQKTSKSIIKSFAQSALGEPNNFEEWEEQWEIVRLISEMEVSE
jgi:hypothetical protein